MTVPGRAYLEDKLCAGYDGIDGVWSVPIMVFKSEKVSLRLLWARENGHLARPSRG